MNYAECVHCLKGLKAIKPLTVKEAKELPNPELFIPSGKFLYTLSINRKKLEIIVSALEEIIKPSSEFKEFEDKQTKLLLKYCIKDDKGEPKYTVEKTNNDTVYKYELGNNVKAFNKHVTDLKEEYKETIEEQNNKVDRYNKQLNEPSEFEPTTINFEDIPLGLTQDDWEILSYIIE